MKITLDDGTTYDVSGAAATSRLTNVERTTIRNALHDAASLLDQDHHVIASIAADIQASVSRIEVELGAHPAFTWAQTKLGNAIAHLEAYVKGAWEEPQWPAGVALDQRGMIVPATQGVITNAAPAGKGVAPEPVEAAAAAPAAANVSVTAQPGAAQS